MKSVLKGYLVFVFIFILVIFKIISSKKEYKEENYEEPEVVTVMINGAVFNPGIKVVNSTLTLRELFYNASMIPYKADISSFNLDDVVKDGNEYYIPYIKKDNETNQNIQTKININTATLSELMNLPGIGEAKAKEIIEYRSKNGPFRQIIDIMKVVGIKEGTYEAIKELITV